MPPAFPRDDAEETLDHERVRVWDVTWLSGRAVPLHVHPTDTGEDGAEGTTTYSETDIGFLPAGTAHTTRVVKGSPPAMFYELTH